VNPLSSKNQNPNDIKYSIWNTRTDKKHQVDLNNNPKHPSKNTDKQK
jgi:hypothetical protein